MIMANKKSVTLDESVIKEREENIKRAEKYRDELKRDYDNQVKALDELRLRILNEKDSAILEKNKKLSKLEFEISEITEKKNKLDNEFKISLALQEEKLKTAELKNNAQISLELSKRYDTYINKLEEENKKIISGMTNFLNWNSQKFTEEFDNLIKQYESMLKSKQMIVENELKIINSAKEELEKKLDDYSDIEELKSNLEFKEKKLNKKEEQIEKVVRNMVEDQYKELINESNKYKELYNYYLNNFNQIQKEFELISNKYLDSENLSNIALREQNKKLRRDMEKMVEKYGVYTDESFSEISFRAKKADELERKIREALERESELKLQIEKYKTEERSIDTMKFQIEGYETTIRTERALMAKLREDIENLESRLDNKKLNVIASEAIERPVPDFIGQKLDERDEINEIEWLDNILNKCEESGYKFSKRLLYSFHTSLKTNDMSPLTVLAGVSGTGKSKLPQLYSRFGGIYFLSLPVQPDWDSPQSLFGYFNSIEKRFNATTLLRALVSFQRDKSQSIAKEEILDLSDNLLIVLLDEMNLAHIELYFSDLLSKLEEKRGEDKDIYFEIDLGAGNGKYNVFLTDNVLWVGTMNEDETTKSLSDKVIDRGNVISFPRPVKFEMYKNTTLANNSAKINKIIWQRWINSKVDLTESQLKEFNDTVVEINKYLKTANRAIGHRVWQSIQDYMMSHPLVNKYFKDEEKLPIALKYAFEEAIVHKVITKLRGIETDGELKEQCLEPIKESLERVTISLSKDFNNALKSITGTFVWDSADYLDVNYEVE